MHVVIFIVFMHVTSRAKSKQKFVYCATEFFENLAIVINFTPNTWLYNLCPYFLLHASLRNLISCLLPPIFIYSSMYKWIWLSLCEAAKIVQIHVCSLSTVHEYIVWFMSRLRIFVYLISFFSCFVVPQSLKHDQVSVNFSFGNNRMKHYDNVSLFDKAITGFE